MESIMIYPKDEKQKSLLKSLLEELKVHFEIGEKDETLISEDDFYEKINKSILQAEAGKTTNLPKDKQKDFFGL